MKLVDRPILRESISQLRFTLRLWCIAGGAIVCCTAVWCQFIMVPLMRDLSRSAVINARVSGSLARLVEVASNPDLPSDQRTMLTRAQGSDIATGTMDQSGAISDALRRATSLVWLLGGLVAAFIFTGVCGLVWSSRVVAAESGSLDRLRRMVDGDLRIEAPPAYSSELPVLQRGIRRSLDELRSMTRRDIQLMNEVGETVRLICSAVADRDDTNSESQVRLRAAAEKIRELERIASRFRY